MAEPAAGPVTNDFQHSLYDCLHDLADRAMRRESSGTSIQATMLVNDAYLKLLDQKNVDQGDRSQVRAAGANIIRRLLVDHARKRKAEKRGGAAGRGVGLHIAVADTANQVDMLELNDALDTLGQNNARAATVVELKFFGGLSGDEIAEQLDVSLRTVNNDWRFAKAWLYKTLAVDDESTVNDE